MSREAPAAAPRQTVEVRSDDPVINVVMDKIRDVVRSTFGGDVDFAFGTTG